jgi:hypothetical protein
MKTVKYAEDVFYTKLKTHFQYMPCTSLHPPRKIQYVSCCVLKYNVQILLKCGSLLSCTFEFHLMEFHFYWKCYFKFFMQYVSDVRDLSSTFPKAPCKTSFMCITKCVCNNVPFHFLQAMIIKNIISFYRDNKLLVSGTQDGDLILWSMETQSVNQQLPSMLLFIFIYKDSSTFRFCFTEIQWIMVTIR